LFQVDFVSLFGWLFSSRLLHEYEVDIHEATITALAAFPVDCTRDRYFSRSCLGKKRAGQEV
jgi:hypothetical protein